MDVEKLLRQYIEAKASEDAAKQRRREIESVLVGALDHPDDGSKTHTIGDLKVTIKGVINRKVDWEVWDKIEHGLHPPMKLKKELDSKGWKWIQKNDPDYASRLSAAITETPGAVQVKVVS